MSAQLSWIFFWIGPGHKRHENRVSLQNGRRNFDTIPVGNHFPSLVGWGCFEPKWVSLQDHMSWRHPCKLCFLQTSQSKKKKKRLGYDVVFSAFDAQNSSRMVQGPMTAYFHARIAVLAEGLTRPIKKSQTFLRWEEKYSFCSDQKNTVFDSKNGPWFTDTMKKNSGDTSNILAFVQKR